VTERLPLFPLNSVTFPGLVVPLHVFEERYRRLVADLLEGPDPRRFGVVAIKDGSEVAPSSPEGAPAGPLAGFAADPFQAFFTVGCVAEVASVQRRQDGGYEVIATGTTRFTVNSFDVQGPYLTAETEPLADPDADTQEARALTGGVERAFRAYQKRLAGARESSVASPRDLPDDPSVLSYLVAAASVLDVPTKQQLLAAPGTTERLRIELRLLHRETAILSALPSLPATDLTRQAFHPN
jgi:Lon protease-like protein